MQISTAFPAGNVPQVWADQWGNTVATGTHGGGNVTELRRVK